MAPCSIHADKSRPSPRPAFAGTSVAMGNGNDLVKQAADYVTSSNDEDGIAQALEKFVF